MGVQSGAMGATRAEVLSKAEAVFGSRSAALRWLREPAIGLDGHVPLDLLRTVPGRQLVYDLLLRLERGVYS